jgi:DNA-binding XRE family transcriptional regulator
MSVRRVYQKVERTAKEKSEQAAVRDQYQRERPSLEQALAEGGHTRAVTLGELLQLHQVVAMLKNERKRQHLTLAEVAERADIDQAALSRLENGRNINPTLDTIYRIASALGKTVNCLLQDLPRRAKT